jgi:high-affinity nickel permease
MASSTVATIITNWTNEIGGLLTDNIPAILVVAAGVFGLILLVRLAKRFIGGR